MSVVPMRYRLRAPFSIWWENAKPKMTIGTVPEMRYQPIRASSSERREGSRSEASQAVAMRQRSARKYRTTAAIVPSWMTAVNAAPGVVPAGEGGDDAQVAAAGDRQELGESLDDPQDDGLEEVQASVS